MQHPDPKREKRTILLAQAIISCLMALLMTFIFSIAVPNLDTGLPAGWPIHWLQHWLTAWPIAFILSLGVGPLAFRIAFGLMHRFSAAG